jgi:hypothetical protein
MALIVVVGRLQVTQSLRRAHCFPALRPTKEFSLAQRYAAMVDVELYLRLVLSLSLVEHSSLLLFSKFDPFKQNGSC